MSFLSSLRDGNLKNCLDSTNILGRRSRTYHCNFRHRTYADVALTVVGGKSLITLGASVSHLRDADYVTVAQPPPERVS